MSKPIIEARDLGIRFVRSRKRKLKLRDMIIHRGGRQPSAEYFWPLRNVTFGIGEGEAVGVIGSNGTGKSTLLRLISGALVPDEGSVHCRGKVAPLLQLSAGFSGDLTGRENVYMVAGMHGMTRKQIRDKFDEIVAFSEIEKFIDTPVTHYSSGMKVRLGFSVVTQLGHPILLVDEALAVGDKRFRAKCYKKMESMLAEGRTLFLVSHSEGDLKRFCTRGLYLDAGQLEVDGTLDEALDAYNVATGS
ncbi:ABC transporter ATP-binding protein [Phytomonospora endophytica]|uniref:ABC-2 type transport system ATP-binding protein n=1 Tax=Phytomonospora endophytica TaxID=714109 RepID=A0A841FCQ1_9ACTN|nr:ABC transporter ATP-binding protein [Phytomonospora endophytica]MBB6033185.1 ABC-2 type transport system ATP-binding protein [Phytomonospora endophytica]GIG65412.1 hypothetical protein Pen01_17070 [Phytomonospora endophytica]